MNTWQLARQLKSLLEAATWPDGAGESVFGHVAVTQELPEELLGKVVLPAITIGIGGELPDPSRPSLVLQSFDVQLQVALPGDATGQRALIGGPRGNAQGSSSGRGLLEVQEELKQAVRKLTAANGVRVRLRATSGAAALRDGLAGYAVRRGYTLEAWVSDDRDYPAPVNLVASDLTGGDVSLTWDLPPSRFDRLEVVLRRASGSTPPASATAGTGVTLASALATSVVDSPGAGTYSYSLFAGYDETSSSPTTTDRWSDPVSRSGVAVT